MENKRDVFWQGVRGLCIICVILIHCKSGLEYEPFSFNYTYTLFLRNLIDFPVAVFIFMAGYFIPVEKVEQDPVGYFRKRGGNW